jgi:hypothetical protein
MLSKLVSTKEKSDLRIGRIAMMSEPIPGASEEDRCRIGPMPVPNNGGTGS